MVAEFKQLRRENESLRQEREILNRATAFSPKREVDEVPVHRCGERGVSVQRLCQVLAVSQSGYFAWRSRPASPRRREDLVLLAHIRSIFAHSHENYGSPRVTRELQEEGVRIGRRRAARLMREWSPPTKPENSNRRWSKLRERSRWGPDFNPTWKEISGAGH